MDLDELIRTELTAQAGRAPDARAVLAGVPARARTRRHRRVAAVAAAAAAAVLAAAVPYAALRSDDPAVPTTAAPARAEKPSVRLPWYPAEKPAGMTELARRAYGDQLAAGEFRTRSGATLTWSVTDQSYYRELVDRAPKGVPVRVGPYQGWWLAYDSGLVVELTPDRWAYVAGAGPRGTLLRLGASLRRGGPAVDLPVRFDRLPPGFTVAPNRVSAADDWDASDWTVDWRLTGPSASLVTVRAVRGSWNRGLEELSRTPVRVGGRTAHWVENDEIGDDRIDGPRWLELRLADGVTLVLLPGRDYWGTDRSGPVPDATVERIAAGVVQVPVDYSWMTR